MALAAALTAALMAVLTANVATASNLEPYSEHLKLSQLPDGKVLAEFEFVRTISWPASTDAVVDQGSHYALLPRSIGEVFHKFDVSEMHLTFTQSRWRYDRWGHSPHAAPVGVQLWTWFNSTNVDVSWNGLTNALAGLFCASLNFLDQSVTSEPLLSFAPEGDLAAHNRTGGRHGSSGFQLRYGSLPREAVCTENLTPWTKLLPCQTKSGIASLLNAYQIFDGNFQSMGIHLLPKCPGNDCSSNVFEFTQTLAVVLDPIRTTNQKTWQMSNLFSSSIEHTCPFSQSTTIDLLIPSSPNTVRDIWPKPTTDSSTASNINMFYDIKNGPFDLRVEWDDQSLNLRNPHKSSVHTHRYTVGIGQEHGGIAVDFHNNLDEAVTAVYFESIPWILKLYLHTLTVESNSGVNQNTSSEILRQTYYQAAIDRVRPTVLELLLVLPPKSKTTITIDFDCAFIKYTEHHPDANHGFDLGVGVLTILDSDSSTASHPLSTHRRFYTESLLVRLPTPDFSMPYNVITLTCTLFALFFGSVFNAMIRRFQPVPAHKAPAGSSKVATSGSS